MNALRIPVFVLTLACSLVVVSVPGHAFIGNTFFDSEILSAEDARMLNEKGLELLKTGKEGDKAEWSNPATKSYGSITLGESLQYNGMDCRRIELVNTPKGIEAQRVWYKHTVCDVPGKGWKYLN